MHFRALAPLLPALLLLRPPLAAGQAPEDIRWVDRTGASSECVGTPESAVCAVETALACRVRRDPALCKAAGIALPREEELPFAQFPPDPFAVVEVTGVKYLIRDDEEGDSRRIGVSVRFHGKYGLNWPDSGWRRMNYEVRREGHAWQIDKTFWQPWIRRIGPQDASTDCIGDPSSPVCAIETHIACRVRDEPKLCTDAGGLEPRHFRPKGATVLYIVDRIRRWEPPAPAGENGMQIVVWVAESTDLPRPGSKESPGYYMTQPDFRTVSYVLRRRDGGWHVLSRTERP